MARFRFCSMLLMVIPVGAGAQRAPVLRTSVHVDAIAERHAAAWDAAPRAAFDLRHDRHWLSLQGIGSAAQSARTGWRLHGEGAALLRAPTVAGWSAMLGGERRAVSLERPGETSSLHSLSVTLGRSHGRTGAWIGSELSRIDAGQRPAIMDTSSAIDLPDRAAIVHAVGLWRQFGGAIVSVATSSHSGMLGARALSARDSMIRRVERTDTGDVVWYERVPGGTSRERMRTRWAETELRLRASGERLMVDALIGARPSLGAMQRPSIWMELGGALRMRPALWLSGSAGVIPSRPDLGITHRRFARLGVQLTPSALMRSVREPQPRATALSCVLEETEDGSYLLALRVPHARTVEVSGDLTGWKPVTLTQVAPNRWETTLRIAPGTYRVSIRVDGDRWVAPPGSASVDDDFGGSAGLLVAR